jgi:hypothetical protein
VGEFGGADLGFAGVGRSAHHLQAVSLDGSAYEAVGNGFLLQSGEGFVWTQPFEWDGVKPLTWVVSLRDGSVLSVRGGDLYLNGTARLEATAKGFRVVRWLKKLSS